jgi:hypothetical protein
MISVELSSAAKYVSLNVLFFDVTQKHGTPNANKNKQMKREDIIR